jgi:hypothetical protein
VNHPEFDITESVRDTVLSTIVIQRRIKQAIRELEESAPQSGLLSEYRKLHSTVLCKLQHWRKRTEFILRFNDVTLADLEVVASYLRLISFVESESEGGSVTAH